MSTRKRTSRKLTEAEAWRRLAHEFGTGRMGRSWGICKHLDDLFERNRLTLSTYCRMERRTFALILRQGHYAYLKPDPCSVEGQAYRQRLCLRWARLAERRAKTGGAQ